MNKNNFIKVFLPVLLACLLLAGCTIIQKTSPTVIPSPTKIPTVQPTLKATPTPSPTPSATPKPECLIAAEPSFETGPFQAIVSARFYNLPESFQNATLKCNATDKGTLVQRQNDSFTGVCFYPAVSQRQKAFTASFKIPNSKASCATTIFVNPAASPTPSPSPTPSVTPSPSPTALPQTLCGSLNCEPGTCPVEAWNNEKEGLKTNMIQKLDANDPTNTLYGLQQAIYPFLMWLDKQPDTPETRQILDEIAELHLKAFEYLQPSRELTRNATIGIYSCSGFPYLGWLQANQSGSKGWVNCSPGTEEPGTSVQYLSAVTKTIALVTKIPEGERTQNQRELVAKTPFISQTYVRWLTQRQHVAGTFQDGSLPDNIRVLDVSMLLATGMLNLLEAVDGGRLTLGDSPDDLVTHKNRTDTFRNYAINTVWQRIKPDGSRVKWYALTGNLKDSGMQGQRAVFDANWPTNPSTPGYWSGFQCAFNESTTKPNTTAYCPTVKPGSNATRVTYDISHFRRGIWLLDAYQKYGDTAVRDGATTLIRGLALQFVDQVWDGNWTKPRYRNYFADNNGDKVNGWYGVWPLMDAPWKRNYNSYLQYFAWANYNEQLKQLAVNFYNSKDPLAKTLSNSPFNSCANPVCGNLACESGESISSCPADCWAILTYGTINTQEWVDKLPISHHRFGSSKLYSYDDVKRTLNAVPGSGKIFAMLYQIQNNASWAKYLEYAGWYSQYSAQDDPNHRLYEASLDDFAGSTWKYRGNNSWGLYGGYGWGTGYDVDGLNHLIDVVKSQNQNLKFGITVYENDLTATVANLTGGRQLVFSDEVMPPSLKQRIDVIHFFLLYRKSVENYDSYLAQLHSFFPGNKIIIAASYSYDRIDHNVCEKEGADYCTEDEEKGYFAQATQKQAELLKSGQISGIEFYPAYFGLEAYLPWNRDHSWACNDIPRCIRVTQEMRNSAYQILCNAGGYC
ncbi:MAG: hypothetical protein V1717_03325 [Candidatus Micrarchaeota archaeon]